MADPTSTGSPSPQRTRPLEETPTLAKQAAEYLQSPPGIVSLGPDDVRRVISFMRLASFAPGATVFREGDEGNYLLLLLEGEVEVDSGPQERVPISALGPGSVIGEMSMLDGARRSAHCTALSAVRAAGLSRRGFEILLDEHSQVGAKFVVWLAQRIAERLRALSQQLHIYAQLNGQLQAEVAQLRAGRR
jgi:CRP-like cAMP-binding protein